MTITNQDLLLFINGIKSSSNYDFTEYSDKSLKRRLAKVLVDNKLDLIGLLAQLKNNPVFLEQIVKEITVNTTELFRDPNIWQILKYNLLPKLKNQQSINIWHAGCSTGQEVYSMLMLLHELDLFDKAKVYGTDINSDVLQVAKKAFTSTGSISTISIISIRLLRRILTIMKNCIILPMRSTSPSINRKIQLK
ncbi:MAG: hypothetical protein HC830_03445 [Bacteroidetes bacterium]|nr:hypothetical protein [Bacteroidota bacterium]